MKKHFFKIIILLIPFLPNNIFAQILENNELILKIDTLHVLPVQGTIWVPSNKKIVPNESLNNIFKEKILKTIPQTSKYVMTYNYSDSMFSKNNFKFIDTLLPKIKELNSDIFSKVPIGKNFEKLLDTLNGRYFAIILYSGLEQENYGGKVAKSVAIGIVSAILTGGMFYIAPITVDPFLETKILIIDKFSKEFVFYNSKKSIGSPIDEERIKKNLIKLIERLNNSSSSWQ